jgi:hypothetical protein
MMRLSVAAWRFHETELEVNVTNVISAINYQNFIGREIWKSPRERNSPVVTGDKFEPMINEKIEALKDAAWHLILFAGH